MSTETKEKKAAEKGVAFKAARNCGAIETPDSDKCS